MTRQTICSGGHEGEAYHIEERDDGSVLLLRTTDVDDGPTRSVCISADALHAVAGGLWTLSMRKMAKEGYR